MSLPHKIGEPDPLPLFQQMWQGLLWKEGRYRGSEKKLVSIVINYTKDQCDVKKTPNSTVEEHCNLKPVIVAVIN